jgi:hypothetical protein
MALRHVGYWLFCNITRRSIDVRFRGQTGPDLLIPPALSGSGLSDLFEPRVGHLASPMTTPVIFIIALVFSSCEEDVESTINFEKRFAR